MWQPFGLGCTLLLWRVRRNDLSKYGPSGVWRWVGSVISARHADIVEEYPVRKEEEEDEPEPAVSKAKGNGKDG